MYLIAGDNRFPPNVKQKSFWCGWWWDLQLWFL